MSLITFGFFSSVTFSFQSNLHICCLQVLLSISQRVHVTYNFFTCHLTDGLCLSFSMWLSLICFGRPNINIIFCGETPLTFTQNIFDGDIHRTYSYCLGHHKIGHVILIIPALGKREQKWLPLTNFPRKIPSFC